MLEKVKSFLKKNGFEGVGLIIAVFALLFLGMGWWAGVIGGVFVGKNWEILKQLYAEHLKEKVEDVVDDLKDSIKK